MHRCMMDRQHRILEFVFLFQCRYLQPKLTSFLKIDRASMREKLIVVCEVGSHPGRLGIGIRLPCKHVIA